MTMIRITKVVAFKIVSGTTYTPPEGWRITQISGPYEVWALALIEKESELEYDGQ